MIAIPAPEPEPEPGSQLLPSFLRRPLRLPSFSLPVSLPLLHSSLPGERTPRRQHVSAEDEEEWHSYPHKLNVLDEILEKVHLKQRVKHASLAGERQRKQRQTGHQERGKSLHDSHGEREDDEQEEERHLERRRHRRVQRQQHLFLETEAAASKASGHHHFHPRDLRPPAPRDDGDHADQRQQPERNHGIREQRRVAHREAEQEEWKQHEGWDAGVTQASSVRPSNT